MAILGFKTKKKAAPKVAKKEVAVKKEKNVNAVPVTFAHLIVRPRITEKAGIQSETLNVYTFEVRKDATKRKIAHAVKELYKVTPLRVNMVKLPSKAVFVRGKRGAQSSVKKALVFLKKGDKIEIA
jgi:large subunit ribosomal protein L23